MRDDRELTRWADLERRIGQIEKLINLQAQVDQGEPFARAVAYMPGILALEHLDGRRRRQSRPSWWHDLPVRQAVIAHHRQMTITRAVALLKEEFGERRAPSKSSLGRFWKALDEVRAAQ
ncbi:MULTISPECIES: hypothetical protein [unclassified Sphingomonas]|jgi:hypothetical protein|uniref:hypothetical protein n=1 Tax=unclassified Sphingomonas TaxID=196159 RepID=UPI00082A3822|nr:MULTISPECIES: hypothetical protein [unclassified Sphingomonas]